MKDTTFTLCDVRTEQNCTIIRASIQDGQLKISGHDLGPGDFEYEYWYSFSEAATAKLISSDSSFPAQYTGTDGCRRLIEHCDREGIPYQFFCYR